jgi:hypothetical protein
MSKRGKEKWIRARNQSWNKLHINQEERLPYSTNFLEYTASLTVSFFRRTLKGSVITDLCFPLYFTLTVVAANYEKLTEIFNIFYVQGLVTFRFCTFDAMHDSERHGARSATKGMFKKTVGLFRNMEIYLLSLLTHLLITFLFLSRSFYHSIHFLSLFTLFFFLRFPYFINFSLLLS